MEKISVLIADDHKLIRETWSYILNNDPRFMVVAECGDSEEAVEHAKNKSPRLSSWTLTLPPFLDLKPLKRSGSYHQAPK